MTSITHLRQADSVRHMDHLVALALVQALHRHLAPRALLDVLWSQAASLTGATGMSYRQEAHELDLAFGSGQHSASYTLSHHGEYLGELELKFRRRVQETVLSTAEDLLALAIPALRNALTHHAVCRQATLATQDEATAPATPRPVPLRAVPAGGNSAADGNPSAAPNPADARTPSAPAAAAGRRSGWEDALVLVSLDGYEDVRAAHGDGWAQTLIQTIQSQIREGLRDADSVFQIDEGVLAVLLPRTTEDAAIDVAGKIRVLIAGLHLRDGRITSQLTACMGVVGARAAHTPEDVLYQARAALSEAQQEGASTIRAYRTS